MHTAVDIKTSRKDQMIDITSFVRKCVEKSGVKDGICCVFVPHTTAAVTINENADPDVINDILKGLSDIVPENAAYKHAEGNSTAHIKSTIVGSSVNVVIHNNTLVLGTWQGIYFCEFDGPRQRQVLVKVV